MLSSPTFCQVLHTEIFQLSSDFEYMKKWFLRLRGDDKPVRIANVGYQAACDRAEAREKNWYALDAAPPRQKIIAVSEIKLSVRNGGPSA